MFDFTGRVALVTGGGGGIGSSACKALARLGARVYVSDINGDAAARISKEIGDDGGQATALTLDVTDYEACVAATDDIVAEQDRLDVLISVAGWSETHPFIDEKADYWWKVIQVNYLGTLYPCHAVLKHMVDAKYGRIVTVSSDAGRVGTSGETVYAGAKAGVAGFTKSIAREVGRQGIVANCVAPGVTDTELMRHQDQTVMDKMIRMATLKRLGQPEEVAAALVFFASEEASFITGQVLSVSGGLTMVG